MYTNYKQKTQESEKYTPDRRKKHLISIKNFSTHHQFHTIFLSKSLSKPLFKQYNNKLLISKHSSTFQHNPTVSLPCFKLFCKMHSSIIISMQKKKKKHISVTSYTITLKPFTIYLIMFHKTTDFLHKLHQLQPFSAEPIICRHNTT
ncbi:unnamed protein product [Vicia faba]|uniref:Uncharacterized protein n=1 Tax=Vicia faba TaxID=3906 RepID=A0AAV1AY80_VICFA|nr:unnamed protein product [Vicia faba]